MSIASYCRKKLRQALLQGTVPAWLQRHPRCAYIKQAVIASPPWVKESDFNDLNKRKRELTQTTRVQHVLDHIVPLTHHKVCGLNVPWNTRVVTARENGRKSNLWYDEPDTLLPACEQFELF